MRYSLLVHPLDNNSCMNMKLYAKLLSELQTSQVMTFNWFVHYLNKYIAKNHKPNLNFQVFLAFNWKFNNF